MTLGLWYLVVRPFFPSSCSLLVLSMVPWDVRYTHTSSHVSSLQKQLVNCQPIESESSFRSSTNCPFTGICFFFSSTDSPTVKSNKYHQSTGLFTSTFGHSRGLSDPGDWWRVSFSLLQRSLDHSVSYIFLALSSICHCNKKKTSEMPPLKSPRGQVIHSISKMIPMVIK